MATVFSTWPVVGLIWATLRGQGVGRALLAEAVTFCVRQGFAEIQLWTFQGLDAARRLYETHGFSLTVDKAGRQWGSEVIEQKFARVLSVGEGAPKTPSLLVQED